MPRPIIRTALNLAVLISAAVALSACFQVENGPAFAGGDEVPGFDTTLYTVGRISPSEGEGVMPPNPGDASTWHIRRALNGSYFIEQAAEEEDDMIVSPRRIRRGEYVIEYSTAQDEYWLGILDIEGQDDDRRYNFCIHLNWDEEDIIARAPSHDVRADNESYTGVTLDADNPDQLFNFMSALWRDSELNEWDCTVMGATPPAGMPAPDSDSKVPGK